MYVSQEGVHLPHTASSEGAKRVHTRGQPRTYPYRTIVHTRTTRARCATAGHALQAAQDSPKPPPTCAARLAHHAYGVPALIHVPVADHRYPYCLYELPYGGPVHRRVVQLVCRTRVQGQRRGALRLGDAPRLRAHRYAWHAVMLGHTAPLVHTRWLLALVSFTRHGEVGCVATSSLGGTENTPDRSPPI